MPDTLTLWFSPSSPSAPLSHFSISLNQNDVVKLLPCLEIHRSLLGVVNARCTSAERPSNWLSRAEKKRGMERWVEAWRYIDGAGLGQSCLVDWIRSSFTFDTCHRGACCHYITMSSPLAVCDISLTNILRGFRASDSEPHKGQCQVKCPHLARYIKIQRVNAWFAMSCTCWYCDDDTFQPIVWHCIAPTLIKGENAVWLITLHVRTNLAFPIVSRIEGESGVNGCDLIRQLLSGGAVCQPGAEWWQVSDVVRGINRVRDLHRSLLHHLPENLASAVGAERAHPTPDASHY